MADHPNYILAHEERELARLAIQGDFYRPLTEAVLRGAGFRRGMRVLDVGCGAGDVSLLVSAFVGPEGEIVAIDRSPQAIARARQRAAQAGVENVRFVEGDLAAYACEGTYDAVIGRLVLMYQPDPLAMIRQAAAHVRSGGVVIFQELELAAMGMALPELPLFSRIWGWVLPTCEKAGLAIHMGLRLAPLLKAAGLLRIDGLTGGRLGMEGAEPLAVTALVETTRTLLPVIERLGVATAAEVDIDTLGARLTTELHAGGGVIVPSLLVGAWGFRP